ncbi:hypothetical protein AYK24_02015 [Thermoplasmatales archaeon SG8-52-4]|nr:MAG: hypothetical protein AYK24_02015 [Thermoplasmatales archaeon SG8-52-4]
MKNIGILEVHCHVKFLHTMIRICKIKDTNITIFTTKDLLSRLEKYMDINENYNIVLKRNKEGLNSFLKRVEKICNEKIDLLFVNTIQVTNYYLPRFLSFNPKCKTIMTVHIANAWFKQKFVFNLKKPIISLDTNISSIIVKFLILPKFDAINVIYPPIKDYILNETNYKKEIFTLPFNFYENNLKADKTNKRIKFVVPGQIEEHRREYKFVLDAFEHLLKDFNEDIDLYLLGYPVGNYGKSILKRCEDLKNKGYNIFTFNSFIPEEQYNEIISDSDFIIAPIKIKSRGWGEIQEIYGLTKASAVVFEAIQYAKPLVVPNEFKIIKELENSTIKYIDSKDLENKLKEYIVNKNSIQDLKKVALKSSKYYSLPILQEYFKNNILNKLDSL